MLQSRLFRVFLNQGNQLVDIALNKSARGFDELAVVVKQGRRVAEKHFRLAGQWHIEIRKGKAQIFLRAITAHFTDRMADDAGRCFFPGNIGIGFGADVDGVFQAGGDGTVVFGSHEQYAGRGFDGFTELGIAGWSGEVGNGRIVVVEVV